MSINFGSIETNEDGTQMRWVTDVAQEVTRMVLAVKEELVKRLFQEAFHAGFDRCYGMWMNQELGDDWENEPDFDEWFEGFMGRLREEVDGD
jgi:hypothetical protein